MKTTKHSYGKKQTNFLADPIEVTNGQILPRLRDPGKDISLTGKQGGDAI